MTASQDSGQHFAESTGAPDAIVADGVGRDVLEQRAKLLEVAVKNSGIVPLDEQMAHRPGGINNNDTSAGGWLTYLIALNRWHALALHSAPGATHGRWDVNVIRDIQASLHAESVQVPLENGMRVQVHPKGDYAIMRLQYIDAVMRWLGIRYMALADETDGTPDDARLLLLSVEAQRQLIGEFAWILTHPNADVPWGDGEPTEFDVPAWARALTTFDLIAIRKAHIEVNGARVEAVAARLRSTSGNTDSMPVEAFAGVMANELGVRPRDLARQWSRGEVFVQALMKAEANQRAIDSAKND